jgi:hypothetical protein
MPEVTQSRKPAFQHISLMMWEELLRLKQSNIFFLIFVPKCHMIRCSYIVLLIVAASAQTIYQQKLKASGKDRLVR